MKYIYYSLFIWLVEHINMSLGVGNVEITGKSIFILDTSGFGSFHVGYLVTFH